MTAHQVPDELVELCLGPHPESYCTPSSLIDAALGLRAELPELSEGAALDAVVTRWLALAEESAVATVHLARREAEELLDDALAEADGTVVRAELAAEGARAAMKRHGSLDAAADDADSSLSRARRAVRHALICPRA